MTTLADTLGTVAEDASDGPAAAGPAGADSVFPLRLVPFERYMLADARPAYPMTFVVEVQLEGVPDREALDEAFADALARHPLLTARLARHGLVRRWVPGSEPPPRLRWHEGADPSEIRQGSWIDLRRSAAVAGEVLVQSDAARLRLLFHHAACDGIGSMRFLGDLLAYYGHRKSPEHRRPTLLPIDSANLAYRGIFDVRVPGPVTRWQVIQGTLREGWKVLSRRPLPLQTAQGSPASRGAERTDLVIDGLPEERYLRYAAVASERGVTANDMMLRDMFTSIDSWNREHAPRRSNGWLRVTVPTSLRGKRDSRMPATNVLGYALVTHHARECADPAELLHRIAEETAAIRTWSLGALFVEALQIASHVPGLLRIGSRISRRFSTVVLSNLGDPVRRFRARFPRCGKEIQAGNLTVKRICGAPPIRPGTRAAVALFSYADRLTIGLNADPRWFSPEEAVRFLDHYRAQLEQSAEASGA